MNLEDYNAFVINTDKNGESSSAPNCHSQRTELQVGQIVPAILSGGGGSRLWPLSTNETPKQFLPLIGERTLFQEALSRVGDRTRFAAPIVVGSRRHSDLLERELAGEDLRARLILEPCARNTAPAIGMAAAVIEGMYGPDALMLVTPSDHGIEDVAAFHAAIAEAEPAARAGRLVTFGITPSGPDTGYGYLRTGAEVAPGVREVSRFVEKPSFDVAEAMVADGEHLWNAGIFLFRAGTFSSELRRIAPAIGKSVHEAVRLAQHEGIRIVPDARSLADCPSESVDYAVMEHAPDVAVVPMSPGWSDLGSWDALAALAGSVYASGPVTALECDGCYIRSDGLEVAAFGVQDLIIVAAGKRLLILPRGRSQEVKTLLTAMDSMPA